MIGFRKFFSIVPRMYPDQTWYFEIVSPKDSVRIIAGQRISWLKSLTETKRCYPESYTEVTYGEVLAAIL